MNKRIERLFQIAHLLMPSFLEVHKDILGGRTGVYLAIHPIGKKIDKSVPGEVIGFLAPEKIEEKKYYATEKIIRMQSNDEYSSFESADDEKNQFGGGIRATDFFVAPSGFPPHLDQKFALLVCLFGEEVCVLNYVQINDNSLLQVNESRRNNGEKALTLSQY
jgi:hypothetical protein